MEKRFLLWISLVLLVFSACSPRSEQPGWKGRLYLDNGISVVENPAKPVYGHVNLNLEEELSIGNDETQPDAIFKQISGLAVDREGNIYISDPRAVAIKVFDDSGHYVRMIGRPGEGPGEYQSPRIIYLSPDGQTLHVMDFNFRLLFYRTEGTYLGQATLRSPIRDFIIDAENKLWGIVSVLDEEGERRALEKIEIDGKVLLQIIKVPYQVSRKIEADATIRITTGYEEDLFMVALMGKNLAYGYSGEYKLTIIETDGQPRLIIKNQGARRLIPPEEASKIAEYLKSKYQPHFFGIFTDDLDRMWVLRDNPLSVKGRAARYDIYSQDGYFIYTTSLPYARLLVLKNGKLYARHVEEETGIHMVKRYRIENWNLLKTSLD